jgi:hypothetical protein
MVGYALNPLYFPDIFGEGEVEPIAAIVSDLKVSQSLPAAEELGGILFPTDMISIGAPMVLNLGPAGYDFDGDEGRNGRLIERNLVTGVVSSYGLGVVMQPFGQEFAEVYSALCNDFCWACPPYYQADMSLSQAPARPTGNDILSTQYSPCDSITWLLRVFSVVVWVSGSADTQSLQGVRLP